MNDFKFRFMNKDVYLAYFKLEKKAEKLVRANAREWIDMFLNRAMLIEST